MPTTQRLSGDSAGIATAAEILRTGGLVAFPTETVYGLAADATDGQAVARIYAAKDRPAFNPLIVHVPDVASAEALIDLPPAGRTLAGLWPGPLTMVAPMHAEATVADLVTAGLPTLGVRVPAHPLAVELLRAVGRPLAAPSANPSGRISPTTADHVAEGLSGRVDAILDGGPCEVGLESTIVGFDPEPVLLRPGGVPEETLRDLVGPLRRLGAQDAISSPGQLASHYAPDAGVRLNVTSDPVIGFGDVPGQISLSPAGDLIQAAARLFAALRQADTLVAPGQTITVAPVPETHLGAAINDRLRRAAAPR